MSDDFPAFDEIYRHRPWTVCFYSFRGGVGRTTLAVSTALSLSDRLDDLSHKPFLLDFDLEAPGVDEFESLRPPTPDQKGLIEYIRDYQATGQAPELENYVYPLTETQSPAIIAVDQDGTVSIEKGEEVTVERAYVMRAGRRDENYLRSLAHLDWERFYQDEEGHLFFENLRAGAYKKLGCRYMLVDSRTGLSRIGGVCLGHLADAVVLVFQPTTAHQQGLVDMVRLVRERERKEERPIPRLYVASRVQEAYEGELDHEQCQLALETVERCEGVAAFDEFPYELQDLQVGVYDLSEWQPDPRRPTLHFMRSRDQVRSPCKPDTYVVKGCAEDPGLDSLQWEYAWVVEWVKAMPARVAKLLRARAAKAGP